MKKIAFLLIVASILLVCAGCGGDKTDFPMSTTYEVDTSGDFQFAFHFEKEEPIFEFISPSGIIYKEGSENLTVERATQLDGSKSVYYLFDKGEIGEWTIKYNKLSNESIDFYYA